MFRQDLIAKLSRPASDPWDIVVIGGGAVGAGTAFDAVSRGFQCALFEQHDFAKGTSSRSTKLIHGGVRYLAQGNIALVREALRERGILLQNAPGLVKPLRFVVPCYSRSERWYYWAGLKSYDALSGRWGIQPSVPLQNKAIASAVPGLKQNGLCGGIAYYDAQFNDARLVIALVDQICRRGGVALNYFAVQGLLQSGGRVVGVEVCDQETGELYEVHARAVVNAGGVFSDDVRQLEAADVPRTITPSQGIHLVVDRQFLGGDDAIMIPKTKDGRVLFAIPWLGRVILGTTDTLVAQASLEPTAQRTEVDYLLEHFAHYFERPLRREDILSCFAGLRPLVNPTSSSQTTGVTAKISREHRMVRSPGGLISIQGGKWTTFRKMAEDVVDMAIDVAALPHQPAQTQSLPLAFASGSQSANPAAAPTDSQIIAAIRDEFARTPEDVLARRYRCLLLDARASGRQVARVARIMATELNHSQAWIEDQVESYENLVKQYSLES